MKGGEREGAEESEGETEPIMERSKFSPPLSISKKVIYMFHVL
jgi:hypothetical protein